MDGKNAPAQARPSADFPFDSKFTTIDGHRIHYVELGEGDPVLFIHGNPTWSYIWRNILPAVARETGRRGIALDLLGFGRSDKPEGEYSLALHERIIEGFIEQLNLKNIVLVLQDWGGPLGTYYAVHHPEKIQGLALMETFLWDMAWKDLGRYKIGFKLFRSPVGYLMIQVMNFFVNKLLPGAVLNTGNLTDEVMRRYREPFPTIPSRKAVRRFPQLIPIEGEPRESCGFIEEIEQKLPGVTFPVMWIKAAPGTIITENTEYRLVALKQRLPQLEVTEFGRGMHYLQEDDPERIVDLLVTWMREKRLTGRDAGTPPEFRKAA